MMVRHRRTGPAATMTGNASPSAPSRRTFSSHQGDLRLGAPDELLPREPSVRFIGDPGRPPNGGELELVLERAEPGEHARRGHELDAVRGQTLVAGDRDVICLEATGPTASLGSGAEPAEQVALRLDDLDALEPTGRFEVAPVRRGGPGGRARLRAPRSSSRSSSGSGCWSGW